MYVAPLCNVSLASDGGGEHIDPIEDESLALTDPLPAGRYSARVTLTATNLDAAAAICEIRRVGVDGEPIDRVVVCAPVDQCWQYDVLLALDDNERIAVAPYGTGFLGTIWAAINYQKVS